MTIADLLDAAAARDWYALIVPIVVALTQLLKRFPELWASIPTRLQWLPPVVMGALTGFVDAAQLGLGWVDALVQGVTAGVYIGLGAVGAFHAGKRLRARDSPST